MCICVFVVWNILGNLAVFVWRNRILCVSVIVFSLSPSPAPSFSFIKRYNLKPFLKERSRISSIFGGNDHFFICLNGYFSCEVANKHIVHSSFFPFPLSWLLNSPVQKQNLKLNAMLSSLNMTLVDNICCCLFPLRQVNHVGN